MSLRSMNASTAARLHEIFRHSARRAIEYHESKGFSHETHVEKEWNRRYKSDPRTDRVVQFVTEKIVPTVINDRMWHC